jgi:hypothetical protein
MTPTPTVLSTPVFDLTWKTRASVATSPCEMAVAAGTNGKIYAIGGRAARFDIKLATMRLSASCILPVMLQRFLSYTSQVVKRARRPSQPSADRFADAWVLLKRR